MVAALHRHVVGLANRVPAEEPALPAPQLRRRVDDGVRRVGRPGDAVRRVVQVVLHPEAGRIAGSHHALVAPRGVRVVGVEERRPARRVEGLLFERQDVVEGGSVELHQAQLGLVPVEAVLRGGEADAPVPFVDDDAVGPAEHGHAVLDPHRNGRGAVPHLKQPRLFVEHGAEGPHVSALPRPVAPDDRIVVGLDGAVHALLGVGEALDDVVVEQELLPGADVDQCHVCLLSNRGLSPPPN